MTSGAFLLALSEGERVAALGFVGVVLAAAIPGTIAAVTARQTHTATKRQAAENTEQHGASQELLASLALEVGKTGHKVDALGNAVEDLADSHTILANTVANHIAAEPKEGN
jgi:hypothetical protein